MTPSLEQSVIGFDGRRSSHGIDQEVSYAPKYEGFSGLQEAWVKEAFDRLGFSQDRIKSVVYRPNSGDRKDWMGHWARQKGEFALYKSLEALPPIAQLGTMTHEATHANSPFDRRNVELYGGEDGRLEAVRRAALVAVQSLDSHKYMNGYHKYLCKRFENGVISFDNLVEETNAIMCELRVTNQKHLQQVDQAMAERYGKDAVNISDMAENNLLAIMRDDKGKQFGDVDKLDEHIESVKFWMMGQTALSPEKAKQVGDKLL